MLFPSLRCLGSYIIPQSLSSVRMSVSALRAVLSLTDIYCQGRMMGLYPQTLPVNCQKLF